MVVTNKKGFVLIETIIVMSVLLIGMIILYSNYNKMIINSSKVNYYDNVDDMYTAYYSYKYVNDLATWNSDSDYKVIKTGDLGENFKKIFYNLNIETIYYFSKKGFENIFSEKDGNCEDKPNQLLCYDGTTINYLRSIENKNDTSKCGDSNVPCITIVKINRDVHYYFAKYEAYNDNEIKIDNDIPDKSEPFDFDDTGKNQIFSVPYTGEYELEVWGAQGGYGKSETDYPGGYGAYSFGTISLHKGDNIFVVVGSKGESAIGKQAKIYAGGFNGGGSGYGSTSYYVSGGGGATHIAKQSGLLTSFEGNLSNLLIVAAGGGGSAYQNNAANNKNNQNYGQGGSGGGYIGVSATTTVKSIVNDPPLSTGGMQDSSGSTGDYLGSFGKGASCDADKKPCSGGGGGLYGGGSGANVAGGSGGSSYIGSSELSNKVIYCYNCQASTEEATKTISTTCHSKEATSNCAKEGNGHARIKYNNRRKR